MNTTFAWLERNEIVRPLTDVESVPGPDRRIAPDGEGTSFAPAAAMRPSFRLASILFIVAGAGAELSIEAAEPSNRKAFLNTWQDRDVALRRTLYSVVYDERRRFLPLTKQDGKVAGLTVATPSGVYYQFDARRDSEDDIVGRDPNAVVTALREQYRRSTHLDIGNVKDVETVMLVRYEPGVVLVVRKVLIERDRVRLMLHNQAGQQATTLTVKWPAPLSKDLTESAVIEGVLDKFLVRS